MAALVFFLNTAEKAMDLLNIGLSGLPLKSNIQIGDTFFDV